MGRSLLARDALRFVSGHAPGGGRPAPARGPSRPHARGGPPRTAYGGGGTVRTGIHTPAALSRVRGPAQRSFTVIEAGRAGLTQKETLGA
ncbi:hypothetical protein GCM10010273_53300 [Streptomyces lavendulocolor]